MHLKGVSCREICWICCVWSGPLLVSTVRPYFSEKLWMVVNEIVICLFLKKCVVKILPSKGERLLVKFRVMAIRYHVKLLMELNWITEVYYTRWSASLRIKCSSTENSCLSCVSWTLTESLWRHVSIPEIAAFFFMIWILFLHCLRCAGKISKWIHMWTKSSWVRMGTHAIFRPTQLSTGRSDVTYIIFELLLDLLLYPHFVSDSLKESKLAIVVYVNGVCIKPNYSLYIYIMRL